MDTFGKMDANRGDRCVNSPGTDMFTTPCCYADFWDQSATECPDCGAPIRCELETVEQPVCTIRDADEEE